MFVVCQEICPCVKPSLYNMATVLQESKIGYIGMTNSFHLLRTENDNEIKPIEDSIAVDRSEDGVVIARVSSTSVDLLIRRVRGVESLAEETDNSGLFSDYETVSFPRPADVSSIRIFYLDSEGLSFHFP